MKKGNPIALLPIGVFLVLYLGLGLLFEYGMKIPMGFYSIPIVIAFLAAILVACLQNRKLSFDDKLAIMGQGVGDKNIITMLLIFLTAGAFVGVVGRSSAQSVAYFMLDLIPADFAVAVLFVVACFVSTAMGTSVGTITLIMPIALEVACKSPWGCADRTQTAAPARDTAREKRRWAAAQWDSLFSCSKPLNEQILRILWG